MSLQDDPAFGAAFIDIDEWRENPIRHRYLHGGFEGTETRFSMYLPEERDYRGRMVQEVQGGLGGSELSLPEQLEPLLRTAFRLGAFLVGSNQGWTMEPKSRPGFGGPGLPEDPSILSHRASAHTARFAKATAERLLGSRPHHAYLIGGSGGGARSVACMERVPGLWDGAVPMVMVNQHLAWHLWSVWDRAERVLRGKRQELADAVDAAADPFAVLDDDEQRDCLSDLYSAGYPRRAEYLLSTWNSEWPTWIAHTDPDYIEDFWTLPDYAGSDQERIRETATVTELVRAADPEGHELMAPLPEPFRALIQPETVVGARLRGVEVSHDLIGCWFTVGGAGREILRACTAVAGDCIGFAHMFLPGPQLGDVLELDNAITQSWPKYHRHVIDPARRTMQRWAKDGQPAWPQRPLDADRRAIIGALPTGRFQGKMILVQTALDHVCPPAFAQDYVELVRSQQPDSADSIRLWIIDNAMHGDPFPGFGPEMPLRFVTFMGAALQALEDLVAWVEDGVPPATSTGYELDEWNQTLLAPTAESRAGIQPLISIDGPAQAKVGEPVRFSATVVVPPGSGSVVEAAWDLDGTGSFKHHIEIEHPTATWKTEIEHRFEQAGVGLAVLPPTHLQVHSEGENAPGDALGKLSVPVHTVAACRRRARVGARRGWPVRVRIMLSRG